MASQEGTHYLPPRNGTKPFSPVPPVTVGTYIQSDNRTKSAAILQCGPIIWEHLATGTSDLKTWGKENAKHILEKETLTRDHGFFIVSATRKTKWCKLKCWSINTWAVAPTLSAGLPFAGSQIEAKMEVQKGEKLNSGWIVRAAEDENVGVKNGVVLNIRPSLKSSMSFVEGFLFISRVLGILVQASADVNSQGRESHV